MGNLRDCHAYKPWRQHASKYSDSYPVGYEGMRPYFPAVLEVNLHEDERQVQLANQRKVNEVLFKTRVGDATLEQPTTSADLFITTRSILHPAGICL